MKILDIPQSGKRGLVVSQGGRYGQISHALVIPTNPCLPSRTPFAGLPRAVLFPKGVGPIECHVSSGGC
jgi:hypothetical protein